MYGKLEVITLEVRVRLLGLELARSLLDRMIEIDAPHVSNETLEAWSERHYLFELKDKWRLSSAAFVEENLVGYRIVSGAGKIDGWCHSHRTSIAKNFQRSGIGSKLLNASVQSAKSLKYDGMTGMLAPGNHTSRAFLIASGWIQTPKLIRGNELWTMTFDHQRVS